MNLQNRTRNVVLGVLCVMVMLIVALFSATLADPPRTVTHVPPLSAPPDANIVYLYRHATDLHTDLIAPENIARTLGATVVSSWDEVLEVMDPATIDAIILHKSAAETMDTDWLKAAYARRVVVA